MSELEEGYFGEPMGYASHDNEVGLAELLVGRSIVETEGETLILDDGTELAVVGNEGCGGCPSGFYSVERVSTFPNAITSVSVVESEKSGETVYSLYVYAEGVFGEVATITGDDGNGYYGTGFRIYVSKKGSK